MPEDNQFDTNLEDVVGDDSEVPMPILIVTMTNSELPKNVGVGESGGLVSLAEAEDIDIGPEIASMEADFNKKPNLDEQNEELEG